MSRFRNIPFQIFGLSIISWFLMFSFFQYIDPFITVSRCSFPNTPISEAGFPVEMDKVLVIADPQLIDNHTYSYPRPVLSLARLTVNNYLYKNYMALITMLMPDMVVFVGDLLDNGRESSDEHYENEFNLFNRIFVDPLKNKDIQIITNVPGNHDIGWADGVTKKSLERFNQHFGKSNVILQSANHDLVLLDDLSFGNTEEPEIYGPSNEFLDKLRNTESQKTRILFSHVPLWRDVNTQVCGPRREQSIFPISKGYQYQTVIEPEGTQKILSSIKPDAIFSGDDHDYCEVVLRYQNEKGETKSAENINVKSMSMAMGIRKPAVQLLSLYHEKIKCENDIYVGGQLFKKKGEKIDYASDICYISRSYVEVIFYILLAIVNACWLLFNSMRGKYNYQSLISERKRFELIVAKIKKIQWLQFFKLIFMNFFLVLTLFCIMTFI